MIVSIRRCDPFKPVVEALRFTFAISVSCAVFSWVDAAKVPLTPLDGLVLLLSFEIDGFRSRPFTAAGFGLRPTFGKF